MSTLSGRAIVCTEKLRIKQLNGCFQCFSTTWLAQILKLRIPGCKVHKEMANFLPMCRGLCSCANNLSVWGGGGGEASMQFGPKAGSISFVIGVSACCRVPCLRPTTSRSMRRVRLLARESGMPTLSCGRRRAATSCLAFHKVAKNKLKNISKQTNKTQKAGVCRP